MNRRLSAARGARLQDAELQRHVRGKLTATDLARLEHNIEIDALGTFCPEPVIRTQDHMQTMRAGEVLLLWADDAGVEIDIPAWCMSTGNEYLGLIKEEAAYRVYVKKR